MATRPLRSGAAAILVGIAGAGFAITFRLALHHGLALIAGNSDVLTAFQSMPAWKRLLLPAAGAAVAGLIAALAARAGSGHGVAEVLEAVALGRGEISLPAVLWKSLGSLAAILGGGSVGREGSIIQFGAGSGSFVGRRLGLDASSTRTLVAAGTAAGFAAAYNTPIAAVVFVVEIVTGVINLEVVLPVVIATATATALTRLAIGGGPIYGERAFQLAHNRELFAYALLGLAAGVAGPAFMELLELGERAAKKLPDVRWLRAAIGGAIVGAIALRFPEVTGNGYEAIGLILDAKIAAGMLAALLLLKSVATVSSVSSGSPGGVFTPTLFLGAALGGLFGHGVALLLPNALHPVAAAYALVGMAAMIAATTHAPLMAATLVFELSGDYSVVLPLLLCTTLAAALARKLRPDSIYTEELARRGVPWRGNLTERLARTVRAADILRMDAPWLDSGVPSEQALAPLERGEARVVYVGRDPLRAIDVECALSARRPGHQPPATAGELAREVSSLPPTATLVELSEALWRVREDEVPIVDPGPPWKFFGVVTRRDLLGAIDREVLQRDVLLTRIVRFEGTGESADFLELPRGRLVEEVAVPESMVGRPIEFQALREKYGVVVIGLRRGRRGPLEDATREAMPGAKDRLLVIAGADGLAKLRASA